MSFEDGEYQDAVVGQAVHDAIGAQEHLSEVVPIEFRHAAASLGGGGGFTRSLAQELDPSPRSLRIILRDVTSNRA